MHVEHPALFFFLGALHSFLKALVFCRSEQQTNLSAPNQLVRPPK